MPEFRPRRAKPQTTTRACLCCRHPFASEGPHNRLCDGCRVACEDTQPFEPDHITPFYQAGRTPKHTRAIIAEDVTELSCV